MALKALKSPPDIVKRIFDAVLLLRCVLKDQPAARQHANAYMLSCVLHACLLPVCATHILTEGDC